MPRYSEDMRGESRSRYGAGGGHSRSRRYEEDDDDRQRGQMARSERAERARRDSEGYSEDTGRGGWFGDPEGHSQASRRGWESPRHRPSGWFGDPEGHSEASREGWENPRHRPSGWFGDPEGHSRASRRGWGEDDGGHSSRGRYEEDEDEPRYSRSRGRYD